MPSCPHPTPATFPPPQPLTPHDGGDGGGTAASRDVTITDFALQLIGQAQQLPEMPEFVDHRPLLVELRRWEEELQAARGDVQAARQAADEAGTANAQQLGAADEAADPEGWHRLSWLRCGAGGLLGRRHVAPCCRNLLLAPCQSARAPLGCTPASRTCPHVVACLACWSPPVQPHGICPPLARSTQYPLIAARLREVDGKVEAGVGPALTSLQQLRERIESIEVSGFCLREL